VYLLGIAGTVAVGIAILSGRWEPLLFGLGLLALSFALGGEPVRGRGNQ
jgi:hypothetical protein